MSYFELVRFFVVSLIRGVLGESWFIDPRHSIVSYKGVVFVGLLHRGWGVWAWLFLSPSLFFALLRLFPFALVPVWWGGFLVGGGSWCSGSLRRCVVV